MVAKKRSFEVLYKAHMICPVIILESTFSDMNRRTKTFVLGSMTQQINICWKIISDGGITVFHLYMVAMWLLMSIQMISTALKQQISAD